MNRPRWQKIVTDMWSNRSRSLLVVASITVGLFAVGVIATLYVVIAQDMRTSFMAANPANIYIRTALYDEALVDSLARLEGVRQAEGVRLVDLRVRDRLGEWASIEFKSVPDLAVMDINQVGLAAGTWPPGDGEVVLARHKLDDLDAPLGGTIQVERPSGKTRDLKVVGVVEDVTIGGYSFEGGFFEAAIQAYVNTGTLELLEQPAPEQLSGVYLIVSGAGDDMQSIRAVGARASEHLENNGVNVASITTRASGEHPNHFLVSAILDVLLVLGLLIVFLSGFLITNTLQALLSQQVQQIGIMKTVGAQQTQIAGVYVFLILGFGLLAYVIAAPLSDRLSFSLLGLLAEELNFSLQGERIIWPVVLLQASLALLMPLVAAWLPIWKGTRISVQEALSGIGKPQMEKKAASQPDSARPAPGLPGLGRLSRPLLISLRNTFRRKGRLALTLITLSLGGAVFIATFNVQISLGRYIDQIGQYFLSDVNVSLDRPYRTDEIKAILSDVEGVGWVEGWAAASAELIMADGAPGDRVQLLAPPAESQVIEPVMITGRWVDPLDQNAIVLNELFMTRFPDLAVGKTLKLQVNGKETEWVVVGFFRFAGRNGGYSAYASFEYLSRLINQPYKAAIYRVIADRPDSGQASLTAAEQDRLAKMIEARLDAAAIRVVNLSTGAYLTGIASGPFMILIAFLLFLAILTALVGSIGLTGTMSMNVMDRTREIGVMRAIGASDQVLIQMVLIEGILIGMISYLLGALLSFPISKLLADGISLAIFEAPASAAFTGLGFMIWLAMVVALSLIASLLPARSAARLTIREVLSYE